MGTVPHAAPRRLGFALIAVTILATVIVGVRLGYSDLKAYAVFLFFVTTAAATGWRLGANDPLERTFVGDAIRASTAAVGIIVFCGLVLGAAGHLTVPAFAAAQVGCYLAAVWLVERQPLSRVFNGPALPLAVAALIGALAAFAVGFGLTHAPLTLYDSLSYHLYFSGRWLQDHALSILPTPFSDPAQAYAPGNGELFFVWLMLPFHGDLLARVGQLPFALLGAATLYALARRIGAAPDHAVYPAAFFLMARPILEQAVGANVDVICASMFLVSLYLGLVAVDRDRVRDWLLWGVAVGLFCGTKYVAAVYAPLLVLSVFARGYPRRLLWGLPGIVALGLPWYVRNWVVAGSPLYPATLSVAGLTIARGAFTRSAMLNTIFHTSDLRLFPVIAAAAFGPTLALVWFPFACIGIVAMMRRGWWPAALLALLPFVMAPLFWFAFPVNVDARFLLPALGPALLPLAFVFGRHKPRNALVHVAYTVAMVWILVGVHAEIPATTPAYMAGWLALDGLVSPPYLSLFAALTLVLGAAIWTSRRLRGPFLAGPFAVCVLAAAGLAVTADRPTEETRRDYLDVTSPFIRSNLLYGWHWMADNISNGTVAYTGINLPYPLSGSHLTNRVVYANIDDHPRWRFHNYVRAYRTGRLTPSHTPLATASGELLPVAAGSRPDDALRPRYERVDGSKGAWLGNLSILGVTHLFVASLSAYEVDHVWHNDGDFPVEDDWAMSEPGIFQLIYQNRQVRIYSVTLPTRAKA